MNPLMLPKLIEEARKLQGIRFPSRPRILHVTFLICRNKVISTGQHKKHKTHTKSNNNFKTTHSELAAILNLVIPTECKRYHFNNVSQLAGRISVVNIRVMADGSISNSKPCKFCTRMLQQLGFKEVYFSTITGDFEKLK